MTSNNSTPAISVSKERKPKENSSRSSVDFTDLPSTPTPRKESSLKVKKDDSVNSITASPILKKKNGIEEEANGHNEDKEEGKSPVVLGNSPRKEESVTDYTNGDGK